MNKNTTKDIYIVASGDLRQSANEKCWPAQEAMEKLLSVSLLRHGYTIKRAHHFDQDKMHGFIASQKMGIEVFKSIPKDAYLIVAESIWQYSHHVLAGLTTHQGPILTVANWSGQWPGLVGMLNLNGSLTKAGVKYSSLWSVGFEDDFFDKGLQEWLETGTVHHEQKHVIDYALVKLPVADRQVGKAFAQNFRDHKAIMGVFDEGCMGMYNAIVPDHLIHKLGIFKERLSQSALYAQMLTVSDEEAEEILSWLLLKGISFKWGQDEATELTRNQTLTQCKMYIVSVRIADEFGCDTIGIQYQQGLKDLTVASDLVEGLLNNQDRPPVRATDGRLLFENKAIPHFNEVDECAGIDALITYRLWQELGMSGENTLHDIRWGEHFCGEGIDDFVWVFLISGAAPPSHFIGGFSGAESHRQSPMYFRLGGGTLRGVSRPGFIVWSRIYVMDDALYCDLGIGEVVKLPDDETERRWKGTSPEWPIMHAVLKGVNRDQLMARHKANHIHVVYCDNEEMANRACRIKAVALSELGIKVSFCGSVNLYENAQ